jgi:hypothetical protein
MYGYRDMRVLNEIVKVPVIKDAVWARLGMNPSVPYPSFSDEVLTRPLHRPDYWKIPVSDVAGPTYREFFEELVKLQELVGHQVVVYSDMDASTGEDLDKIAWIHSH